MKVGEKPNGIKGIEYDFDIVLKLCFDDKTNRRYGIVEKDRTGTFNKGDEVDNPSFENWKHVYDGGKKLKSANINLTKDIDVDTVTIENEDVQDVIKEIKSVMSSKLKAKTLTAKAITELLAKYKIKSPDEINDLEVAKTILQSL